MYKLQFLPHHPYKNCHIIQWCIGIRKQVPTDPIRHTYLHAGVLKIIQVFFSLHLLLFVLQMGSSSTLQMCPDVCSDNGPAESHLYHPTN